MKTARFLAGGICLAFLACLPTVRLAAQDDPAPKEPLIPRAPEMSAWTITYRQKQASPDPKPAADTNPKPPDRISSVQIQKTGKIYHRVIIWSSGAQSDTWNVGQRQVTKDRTAQSYVLMPSEGPATEDYSKSDFEDLAWIGMNFYTGYKKGEQPVFVFQAKNAERPMTRREKFNPAITHLLQPAGAGSAKPDPKSALDKFYGDSMATVVLDSKTQLPLAYDDGKATWVYQFTTAPTETLVPPPEVVKILHRFDDYVKGTTLRPSTP